MPETNAIIVNLEEVPRLEANQRVNVTAMLSLGTEKPKQVQLRTTQKTAFVKEDCIIEDSTGSAVLHIWEKWNHISIDLSKVPTAILQGVQKHWGERAVTNGAHTIY